MRRFNKVVAGIAASLFGIGIILAIAGWAMGGKTTMDVEIAGYKATVGMGMITDSKGSGNSERKQQKADLTAFNKLDIDINLGDIDVVASDHYGIDLSWHGRNYDLHYTNENGTLKVWSTSIPNIGINLGGNYDANITVYLPQGERLDNVVVGTALGDVDLSGFHASQLDVSANMGSVSVSNMTVGNGTMELNMGDLNVSAVTADALELWLSMGKLSADDLSTAKELTVENSMGSVEVSGSLAGQTKISASMGDISIVTNLPERDYGYDLNTEMGTVKVNGKKMDSSTSQKGGTHFITADDSLGSVDLEFNG